MNTGQQGPGELWAARQVRRFGFGRNPLRRPSDRIEAALLVVFLIAGLLLVPIGAVIGTSVREAGEQRTAQQRDLLQQVKATTTEDAPALTGQEIGQLTWPVSVVWQDSAAGERRARADVVLGTKTGSEVTVWLDRSGRLVKPPRTAGDSAAIGGATGFGVVLAGWIVLGLLMAGAVRKLNQSRSRQWAAEWEQVAPRWTGRQS